MLVCVRLWGKSSFSKTPAHLPRLLCPRYGVMEDNSDRVRPKQCTQPIRRCGTPVMPHTTSLTRLRSAWRERGRGDIESGFSSPDS